MATNRNGWKEAKWTMDLSGHHAIMTILNEELSSLSHVKGKGNLITKTIMIIKDENKLLVTINHFSSINYPLLRFLLYVS